MKPKLLFALILASIVLTACALPQQTTALPPNDSVATEVSKILTQAPSPTGGVVILPTVQATNTLPVVDTQAPSPTDTAASTAEPPTPEPTASATTAPTPEPAFTPPASDPRAKLGNPTWRDAMDTDRNWPTDTDTFSSLSANNGFLVMTARSEIDGWRVTWPKVKDFYLEMTAKTGQCSGSDHYGMIIRVPDLDEPDQGYLVGLTCDGRYSIREWNGEKMTSLIRWTSSQAIKTGSNTTNRLGVMAVGSRIAIYANGVLLGEVTDDSFTAEGGFGLFVGSDETENFAFSVDEIAYWENPAQ